MARVAYREILEDFTLDYGTRGSEEFKKGDRALCLPNLDKKDEYCVGSDFHVPVWVEKKYLSEELFKVWKD